MPKAAIVVLADTETHGDMGRVTNALEAAKEFKENGDDVKVIFDGAGTKWIGELADEEHDLHGLYREVESEVSGVCSFCADAFGVSDEAEENDVDALDEFEGHPSIRSLVDEGYEVITF
ncbi:MAG: DsrE family protein [Halobacteria archaeon]|nr:DsrE family protein [Halobacteria archaeon]